MDRNSQPVISIEQCGSISVVGVRGNLTIGGGDVALRSHIGSLLQQGRLCLLLDLDGVAYMDSCGLAELVECQRQARNIDAEIKLLSPSTKVRRLLAITMLDQVFDVFADLNEALAAFRSQRLECGGGRTRRRGSPPKRRGRSRRRLTGSPA